MGMGGAVIRAEVAPPHVKIPYCIVSGIHTPSVRVNKKRGLSLEGKICTFEVHRRIELTLAI